MGYLLLSILSSSLIAVTFKFIERYNVKLMPIIVINYFAAVFWGIILNDNKLNASTFNQEWVPVTFIIGIALLIMFNVIGYSTQKIGIAVTTISKEMSVILPISFSIFFYDEALNYMKELGIFLAISAVFLSVYKKRKKDFEPQFIYLPVLLVFGIGFLDTILKFSIEEYNAKDSVSIFSAFSFAIAGIIGIAVSLINKIPIKKFFEKKVWLYLNTMLP